MTENDNKPLVLASGTSQFVAVHGALIHYRVFNPDEAKPGLLFVHGMWAHSHWWDHMIPAFVNRFRVAAVDLSGMGDSARRASYTARGFGEEISAVIHHAGMAPATVVAHSFGGTPTAFACHDDPQAVARAVIIDSRMFIPDMPGLRPQQKKEMPVSKRIYDSVETAVDRYRLIPNGGPVDPDLLRHIAINSLRQEQGGFTWKFDSSIHPLLENDPDRIAPAAIATPISYIYGKDSDVVSAEMAGMIAAYFSGCGAPICVAGSNHHVLLEKPQTLISILQEILVVR